MELLFFSPLLFFYSKLIVGTFVHTFCGRRSVLAKKQASLFGRIYFLWVISNLNYAKVLQNVLLVSVTRREKVQEKGAIIRISLASQKFKLYTLLPTSASNFINSLSRKCTQ